MGKSLGARFLWPTVYKHKTPTVLDGIE